MSSNLGAPKRHLFCSAASGGQGAARGFVRKPYGKRSTLDTRSHRLHSLGMASGLKTLTACLAVTLLLRGVPAAASGEAGPNWVEVRSAHFVVSSNAAEADARRIAEQFEQIRAVFHNAFGKLRVDPPQPVAILAARDESTMKMLAPDEFEGDGHVHPAGLFHSDGEKDYVVMRLDAQGTSAFHTIYHEYTHALLHMNYNRVPLWLNEGLAEFFGNSTLTAKDATTGAADKTHLYVLSKSELLPVETLLQVKENSPYYNEMNRASIFYAESWAVVHYLLLDPEARRQQLLGKFFAAWNKSGDAVEAAREAFGDLASFGETIKRYVQQPNLRVGLALPAQEAAAGGYAVRSLSAAEVLAVRGDFFVHRKKMEQAQPLLDKAVEAEPNLAAAHEALGFFDFRDDDFVAADDEMMKAIELGSTSFLPYYCHGLLLLRDLTATQGDTDTASTFLERAAQINPQFAPTFEALTQAYSRSAGTQKQALEAATRAAQLDPTSPTYTINLIYTLLNNNRAREARDLADKLLAVASSQEDTRTARAVLQRVKEEEEWAKENEEDTQGSETATVAHAGAANGATPAASSVLARPEESRRRLGPPTWIGIDGPIGAIDCSHGSEMMLTLNMGNGSMTFHAENVARVGLSGVSEKTTPGMGSCRQWVGRHVKVWFRMVEGADYMGEILKIYFYGAEK
jgi:tetratricopeptide (TPR) repeat protein